MVALFYWIFKPRNIFIYMIRLKQLLKEVLNNEDTSTVILMTVRSELSTSEQQQLISTEISATHNIIVHDYDDLIGVLSSIKKNPTAFVILFEDACLYASDIAKKLNNKHAMFIAAPIDDLKIDKSIARAVYSGVPGNHVFRLKKHGLSNLECLKQAAKGVMWLIDHPEELKPSLDVKTVSDVEKSKSNVPKINITNFKQQWRALGHTIKVKPGNPRPDELSNGGAVNEVLLGIILEIFKEYNRPVNITGGNDSFHHKLPYVSKHTLGLAVDIVPYGGRSTKLEALFNTYKIKYPNFAWDNEYTNPAKMATGPHYHLYLKK